MSDQRRVRPIAIGLIRRDDELLVMAVKNPDGSLKGWRPLGGAIEFGEHADAALAREFQEEIGQEITAPRLMCVLENIFVDAGQPGHEIAFVFETGFASAVAYDTERFAFEDGGSLHAEWVALSQFDSATPLFPEGLLDRLQPAE